MAPTTGAVTLEVGIAVDLTGVGSREVLDTVGVTGTVGVAAPVGEVTARVVVGLGGVAVTEDDAWPSEGAVD